MEENKSRVYHSLKNARVSLFFSLIAIFIGFFSRKVFLDRLGVEFMGLSGTLQSLLGFLNIAELGIGTAVSYSLYKPLADGDREKVNDIVSVLGYLYSRVGYFILGTGIILSCFLPVIFPKTGMSMLLIYCGFYTYIITSLFSYFLNYRMTLLSADQRNYVVTKNLQMSNITQQLLQIAAARYCANLYLFFVISLLFSGIYCIILNRKINAYYPWLNSTIANGREKLKAFPEIKTLVKQVFAHKIGTFAQWQVSSILIYAFVSLKEVALYGNYTAVISKVFMFTGIVCGSTFASVGNLIANSTREKVLSIYQEMFAMNFLVSGFCIFMFYHMLEPFIILWIGAEYLMSKSVLIMVLINSFFAIFRGTTDQFINGYGLFRDIWAPYAESAILIAVALLGGYFYGVAGVIAGCVASNVVIVGLWKPYFLFSSGIKISVLEYVSIFVKNSAVAVVTGMGCSIVAEWLPFSVSTSYFNWIGYAVCIGAMYLMVVFPLMWLFAPGGKELYGRVKTMLLSKLKIAQ